MSDNQRKCFVIMPFAPELHYFYLYLKEHIEKSHGIECERADAQVLTKPILEKINDNIQNADVLIADCTGRNANVFYELGIAHAHGKKVILITKDPVQEAPADIRHYEFIQYQLDRHREFLERLDNALQNVFVERYEALYQTAQRVFRQFQSDTTAQVQIASKEIFLSRVMTAERTRGLPAPEDTSAVRQFVLPRIIADTNDVQVMSQITKWLEEH